MKKLNKEPYIQIEESENINQNFYNKGIMSSLFHTHLNKIFEKETNRDFNFEKFTQYLKSTPTKVYQKILKTLQKRKYGKVSKKEIPHILRFFSVSSGSNIQKGS